MSGSPEGATVSSVPEPSPEGANVSSVPEPCPDGASVSSDPDPCPEGSNVSSDPCLELVGSSKPVDEGFRVGTIEGRSLPVGWSEVIVVQHFLRAVVPGPGLKQTEVMQASNSPAPITIAMAGLAGSVNATLGSALDQKAIMNISSSFVQEGVP